MKSLMPAPASTVDFAQQSQGMPPPPPPSDGAGSCSSSSSATDPLDTNGDGTVSAEERAAGALNDAIATLFAAADTNGDKTISQSEADTLKEKMDTVVQGLQDSSSASTSSSSTSDTSGFSLSAFVDLVLKQYAQGAAASAGADATSSLSVSA
jgi:hypothetical protein